MASNSEKWGNGVRTGNLRFKSKQQNADRRRPLQKPTSGEIGAVGIGSQLWALANDADTPAAGVSTLSGIKCICTLKPASGWGGR